MKESVDGREHSHLKYQIMEKVMKDEDEMHEDNDNGRSGWWCRKSIGRKA